MGEVVELFPDNRTLDEFLDGALIEMAGISERSVHGCIPIDTGPSLALEFDDLMQRMQVLIEDFEGFAIRAREFYE